MTTLGVLPRVCRGASRRSGKPRQLEPEHFGVAALMWARGADTADIARAFWVPQAVVVASLDAIRRAAAQISREAA